MVGFPDKIYKIEKKRFNLGASGGNSPGERVVYRVLEKGIRFFGTIKSDYYLGLIFTARNGIVTIENGYVNKMNEVMEKGIKLMDDEALKFYRTSIWCMMDFQENYPEYRKYIFL
mgnify:CR=1 FL=1